MHVSSSTIPNFTSLATVVKNEQKNYGKYFEILKNMSLRDEMSQEIKHVDRWTDI
jgi:hypothetical protein